MAGEDPDPALADHMTAFERRSRVLLRAYPAAYRRERGEEIIGTLLEAATPANRTWPRPRDAHALIVGGLKARATQNRHHTTAANLRAAVMVGIAVYLAVWVASYLSSVATEFEPTSPTPGWSALPALLTGLLIAATVLLAWTASPVVLLTGSLAAGAAVSYFALVRGHLVGPAVTQLICLAALMTLAVRGERPSRRWLWPVGLIVAVALLLAVGRGSGSGYFAPFAPALLILSFGLVSFAPFAPALLVLGVGLVSIVWIGIDARPTVAVITYFTLIVVQSEATNVAIGFGFYPPFPLLLVVVVVAALAIWLLRRQSAKTKTVG